jgi:alpha-tubulin suppressor-like RCC1 family protein
VPCLVESLTSENLLTVSCGASHTVAVSDEGYAYSWGQTEYGALGIGNCGSSP